MRWNIKLILLGIWISCFHASIVFAQSSSKKAEKPVIEIDFSVEGGFYDEEIDLELFSNGTRIYYTLDGSYPSSRKGIRYRNRPIKIKKTTPVRAVAYNGKYRSERTGHTYFINEPSSTLPVVSIQITPDILFDAENGLYVEGLDVIDSIWSKPKANFWSKREKKINIEIFESDNECVFRSPAGFRLFGGMSRLFPQKSMTIVARDDYGKKRIKHQLFGKEGEKKFKFLVLRNSGSDFGKAHFRDAFMTSLLEGWDIEKQAYRASHVYLNGEYWGIYNIREKVNRYFLEDHCDIDKDSVDIMEHRKVRKRGSRKHYFNMLDYIKENDLSDPSNYAYLNSLMDIQNFMDYQIAQIYFDNRDAGGNIKYWRPRKEGGRWRWVIYDTDWGFGLHNEEAYKDNSIAFHTEPDGPFWPNPPWSTFILRNLMKNQIFKDQFVLRFSDFLNTSFESTRVLDRINTFYQQLEPEIGRQHERWNLSKKNWLEELEVMRTFAAKRPEYMRMHLKEMFNTGQSVEVQLKTTKGGSIEVNHNIRVEEIANFDGIYFRNLPIHIKAEPHLGYRFSHWEGIDIQDESFTLALEEDWYQLKAVFEPYIHPLAGKVIINEVNANYKRAGDWVEIFNNSEEAVQMKNWMLVDDAQNEFQFPEIELQPNNYLIVCENKRKFQRVFPSQYKIVGDMNFGLNKRKEVIRLFSNSGEAIDSIGYDVIPVDSAFTFNLLLPELDNGNMENWSVVSGYGTPNAANPYYLESRIRIKQERWVRLGSFVGVLLVLMLLIIIKKGGR